MKFRETVLKGAYLIDLEQRADERGFFARSFCKQEYRQLALDSNIVQINNSFSARKGTLRGMHYQLAPKAETKIIRCIRGGIYDAILDLRPDSSTFGKHFAAELSSENRTMLYVPKGFAHGFLSLVDDTEIVYFVTEYYDQMHERCIRWNDLRFSIPWPFEPAMISEKDTNQCDFVPQYHLNLGGKK